MKDKLLNLLEVDVDEDLTSNQELSNHLIDNCGKYYLEQRKKFKEFERNVFDTFSNLNSIYEVEEMCQILSFAFDHYLCCETVIQPYLVNELDMEERIAELIVSRDAIYDILHLLHSKYDPEYSLECVLPREGNEDREFELIEKYVKRYKINVK